MAKTYYTLLSLEPRHEHWSIEFGDPDREVVAQEMQDYRDAAGFGGGLPKGTKFKIIATSPLQVEIVNAVARLNAKLAADAQATEGAAVVDAICKGEY